jgi:hypothetical protein
MVMFNVGDGGESAHNQPEIIELEQAISEEGDDPMEIEIGTSAVVDGQPEAELNTNNDEAGKTTVQKRKRKKGNRRGETASGRGIEGRSLSWI